MKTYTITYPISILEGTNKKVTIQAKDIKEARELAYADALKRHFCGQFYLAEGNAAFSNDNQGENDA